MDPAASFQEVETAFHTEDQRLIQSNSWDYTDPSAKINQVAHILETIDVSHLAPDDKSSIKDTLWLYYHHAIFSAIKHGDEGAARSFSKKALSYLSPDNPNKITQLFYYLTHEKYDEAQKWTEGIDDYQQETAVSILNMYMPKINERRQLEQADQMELERLEQEIQNA